MLSEQELADMERLSNHFEADLQACRGPLVGQQQSTRALIAEYAQADPVYVHKTTALPQKYSHYRTLKGDGNCGWRALAFGYFETLLRLGDQSKILAEAERLEGFKKLLESVGIPEISYGDYVEETVNLLRQIAATLPNHDGGAAILASFNDDQISPQLTYLFRLITSAWMKSNADVYAPFVVDMSVVAYCEHYIEPAAVELDHIGLQALAVAIINEAGIAIDVLYLDRSAGDHVTPHRLPVIDSQGNEVVDGPTIRLLYRPGHYDLLYTIEDVAEMSRPTLANPEVHFLSNPEVQMSANAQYSHIGNLDLLCDIPGFTSSILPLHGSSGGPYQSQPQSFSPNPSVGSPARNSHQASDPEVKEEQPTATVAASPPASKEPSILLDPFRAKTIQQRDYNKYRASVASADLSGEDSPDMSKREDPAHFTNQSFQPLIWRPGREYDRSAGSEKLRGNRMKMG